MPQWRGECNCAQMAGLGPTDLGGERRLLESFWPGRLRSGYPWKELAAVAEGNFAQQPVGLPETAKQFA